MSTPRLDTLTYDQLCELGTKVETQKAIAYKTAEKDRATMRATLDRMLNTLQGSATAPAKIPTVAAPAPTQVAKPPNGKHAQAQKRAKTTTKGQKAPIKFRSGSNTWSGRGKTPAWLAALEKAGQPRATFAV